MASKRRIRRLAGENPVQPFDPYAEDAEKELAETKLFEYDPELEEILQLNQMEAEAIYWSKWLRERPE